MVSKLNRCMDVLERKEIPGRFLASMSNFLASLH